MVEEKKDFLTGKRVLIVDDEADILDILEEDLSMCNIERALSFGEAKDLIEKQDFDLAILDIMGVDGFKLLELAREKEIITVMLTAHAISMENIEKSYQDGASYYIPKGEMNDIEVFLNDVFEANEKEESTWQRWFNRLGDFFEKRFGATWQEDDKWFWTGMTYF